MILFLCGGGGERVGVWGVGWEWGVGWVWGGGWVGGGGGGEGVKMLVFHLV